MINKIMKNSLEKIFPNAKINVEQSYGIMKVYIKIGNYFLNEIILDVIGKTTNQIIKEIINNFTENLFKYMINEEEYLKIMEN